MSDPVYTIEQRARDGTLLSRMVGRYNRKTQTVEPVSVEYFVNEKARENHKKNCIALIETLYEEKGRRNKT